MTGPTGCALLALPDDNAVAAIALAPCNTSRRVGVMAHPRPVHSRSATTNDHHGAALVPSMPLQYQADTSGQLAPRWSRISSQTISVSVPWLARKQLVAAPAASFLTGIGAML